MSSDTTDHSTDASGRGSGSRLAIFVFGLLAYSAFFAAILYAIGFVGGWVVPKAIDDGEPGSLLPSLLINGAMLVVFVVQHTIMARPAFKKWFTKMIPAAAERSTFVLASSAILLVMFWQWQPLPEKVWDVSGVGVVNVALIALSLLGWATVFYSSFLINHFDLFGVRQVWLNLQGRDYEEIPFRIRSLYKLCRHPLMVGFMMAFWATPTMTVGHLFFAIMTTGYIFFGVFIEERDLVAHFGDRYLDYRKTTRSFLPIPRAPASKRAQQR